MVGKLTLAVWNIFSLGAKRVISQMKQAGQKANTARDEIFKQLTFGIKKRKLWVERKGDKGLDTFA